MITGSRRRLYSLVRIHIRTAGYILAMMMLLLLTCPTPADAANVEVEYHEAKSADLKEIRTKMKEASLLENLAAGIKASPYPFHNTLTLVADECNRESAYYRPKTKTITMCYEIVRHLIRKAEKENASDQERGALWGGAFGFVFMHEFGHALFDLLDIKLVGREEDVADQFATDLALSAPLNLQKPLIIGGIWYFERKGNESYSKEDFANEHSLNDQRFYNIMCWAYGKDSSLYADFKKFLKDDRALGCGNEYKQMREGLVALGHQIDPLQVPKPFSPFPLVVNQIYKHPNYPTFAVGFDGQTFLGMQQSMSVPLAMMELSSFPNDQWVSVPSIDQRQLPVMIMRRGYSLTAKWLP